jgi:nitrite reductase/ring-hydroxylating ferredoxin subunit
METFLANESDVREGETKEIDFAGRPAILFRLDGEIHAYINCCTHLGGPMKLKVKQNTAYLDCTWHDSHFDAKTGQCLREPAPLDSRLIKLPIEVKEGKVFYVYP